MNKLLMTTAATLLALGSTAFADNMIDTAGVKVEGKTATFAKVSSDKGGYLVLHEVKDGAPVVPGSIGHVAIPAGESTDVAVEADMDLAADAEYMVMLHEETNGNDTYDFGEGTTDVDTPTMADGKPVVMPFTATMASMDSSAGASAGASVDTSAGGASAGGAMDSSASGASTATSGEPGSKTDEVTTPSGGVVPGQTPK
ncbi:hypothetical protein VQ045_20630 [Aurantimonas sp. E1-2-R+4]|uniref:DUF7282 domain-containing protein n=1 Tax=Aurantimonas sp. E1-2-R+4 TaxID=3113714 RepID=UPI002F91FC5B